MFVVGPSGAGKDTLIAGAREKLRDDARVIFLKRTVTRPAGEWEDHYSATPAEFDRALAEGCFAFWWGAHGLRYGVGAEAVENVQSGGVVVCNGSRDAIADALPLFPRVCIVYVTVAQDVLAARLKARGREADVAARIERKPTTDVEAAADLVIRNDGAPETGIAQLVAFLQAL